MRRHSARLETVAWMEEARVVFEYSHVFTLILTLPELLKADKLGFRV